MRRIVLFFVLNFFLNVCFGVTFNYYYRNEITGSYQLKNIENISEQYRFIYTVQENEIVGYYFDSSIIKFIDVIDGDKVIKSTYFAKETGKVIYEKLFFYGDDSKIKSFIYTQLNDTGDTVYEMKSFFSTKDSKIIYNSNVSMIRESVEHKLIVNGLLSQDYDPLMYKSYGIVIDNKNRISQTFDIEEVFSYDDSYVTSKLFQNNKLSKSKKRYLADKSMIYEEVFFDVEEKQVGSKQYILNGSLLTQIMTTNSETVNEYNYFKIDDGCYLLGYDDWDNSTVLKIEIFDETVYLKKNIAENLKYPINLFDFPMY